MIERPVFVVAPPRSGAELVRRSLAAAPGVFTTGKNGNRLFEAVYELNPANRGWDSNRLTAADAQPHVVEGLRTNLKATLLDRDGRSPGLDAWGLRWVDGTPRSALRIPFLKTICPDAIFIYVHREPSGSVPEMVEAWTSGIAVSYSQLPGWEGPPWSHPLVPGWRELSGRSVEDIAVEQWVRIAGVLLEDLEALPRDHWCVVDRDAMLKDPRGELERLCGYVALELDEAVSESVATWGEVPDPAAPDEPPEGPLAALLPRTSWLADRARDLVAEPLPPASPLRSAVSTRSPLRSVYTQGFSEIVDRLSSSLLVSTYQTGKLICLRHDRGILNTHFRDFQRPMGLAVAPGRIAIGTRAEVLDYRDFPAVASKLAPTGRHDACFIPRASHFTGDVRVHEIAFVQGELWLVATEFSCLATLDPELSFVPRWTPPFITELAPEDRCHLNGVCVVDDRIHYVTALGETDQPGGWRENKSSGGVLIDVESGETVLRGLSMPHSPRWHEGRLWLLESGKGTISVTDLEAGTVETVAELPGFTRGLAFADSIAFVGLSQVRETATFGGLPLTDRLEERQCGVWAVDTRSGRIIGFVRFEDLVQEIFDVAVLHGLRYPEISEEGSDAATHSFVLP